MAGVKAPPIANQEGTQMKTPPQSADVTDLITVRGTGGEIHPHAADGAERLTTA